MKNLIKQITTLTATIPLCIACQYINPETQSNNEQKQQEPQQQQEQKMNTTNEQQTSKDPRTNANQQRSDIPDNFKWDTTRLFASNDDFQAALKKNTEEIKKLDDCKNFKNAQTLMACLDNYFQLHTDINKLTLYTHMLQDTTPSDDVNAMNKQALSLMRELMTKNEKIRNAILQLKPKELEKFKKQNKNIEKYHLYINNILRRQSRILSPDAEMVLQLAGDNLWAEIDLNELPAPSEEIFHALLSEIPLPMIKDDNNNDTQLTLSNYTTFRRSQNRETRKNAVHALMSTLYKNRNTLAQTYIAQLKTNILFAKARKYNSALEAYLDKDDIKTDVYTNLIETVNKNLEPLHKYVQLRKKALKLDTIHLYDLYIPITTQQINKEITFEDANQILTSALKPLGEDYLTKLNDFLNPQNGSLDLFPHKNKRSGAYSASVYGIKPYVFMNYFNDLDDLSTLAHELGHAIHSSYSMENQTPDASRYTSFIAEIASTTNEAILNDYLLANTKNDTEKIPLLVDKLENIRSTIYRQTLFAEFELAAHTAIENNIPVNADWLQNKYKELIEKYYGPDFTIDEHDPYEWSYVPHFYWKYYVFTYATGLASALSFAKLIQQDPQNTTPYINMLKAGASKDPLTLLKNAGVDLTQPQPIQNAMDEFKNTLETLEKILDTQK